jgi:hypothetical protein
MPPSAPPRPTPAPPRPTPAPKSAPQSQRPSSPKEEKEEEKPPEEKPQPSAPYDPTASYLNSDDVYMGVASDIAYRHRINLKTDRNTADAKTNAFIQSRMEGHSLMPEYSNENQVVIRRPDNSIIFAVRGTDPTNPLDLWNDALIATGTMSSAPLSRLTEVEKVFNTLPKDSKVTLTGHSLGADIARRIGEKYDKRSVTFSTPEVYPSIPTHPSHNTTYLTNKFDIVSSANKYINFSDDLRVLPETSTKFLTASHDISNFLPPERMYPLGHVVTPNPKNVRYPIKHREVFTAPPAQPAQLAQPAQPAQLAQPAQPAQPPKFEEPAKVAPEKFKYVPVPTPIIPTHTSFDYGVKKKHKKIYPYDKDGNVVR